VDQSGLSLEVEELLKEFQYVFQEPTQLPQFRTGHDHQITLSQGVYLVNRRPYRYAKTQKDIIDKLIHEYLKFGIFQKNNSPYASPVVLVGKKDGSWRLCMDYRELNKGTVKNRFHIPLVDDLLDELNGSTIFSKIDLRVGYNQVRMDPADIWKTTFRTHSRHYEYLVMPFGLTNAPATFQGLINTIFQQFLRKYLLVLFDNILIYSKNLTEHLQQLRQVLVTLRLNSLFAKRSKCYFAVDSVEYLGHIISGKGVSTDPNKIAVIVNWPLPPTLKQLMGFSRLAGYYRRFVKGYGVMTKPLIDMLRRDNFTWTDIVVQAFDKLKTLMSNTLVLALPNFSQNFVIEVDACDTELG